MMHATVFIAAPDRWLPSMRLDDVASLVADVPVYESEERISLSMVLVAGHEDISAKLQRRLDDIPCVNLIIVSHLLVTTSSRGPLVPSDLAKDIEQTAIALKANVGLVAVADGDEGSLRGIDACVSREPVDARELRRVLIEVANRLWLKCKPTKRAPGLANICVRPVQSKDELKASFALRRTVYGRLGYLLDSIERSESKIELDGYDPQAQHFVAIDQADGDRVVGTMRLILPGLNRDLPVAQAAECSLDYGEWCKQIADEQIDRVFRDRLVHWAAISLPVFDSFDYMSPFDGQVEREKSCEISRVVVAPFCRGRGISRCLVEKAVHAASILRRSCLLLECAPHHESLYAKFGFRPLRVRGEEPYYARAQRLDQLAVAMCRDLRSSHGPREGAAGVLSQTARPSARPASYLLAVEEGPAAGCRLTFESSSLTTYDLECLVEVPPSDLPTGRSRADPSVTARGTASFRAQILASIKSSAANDVVECLRAFLSSHDSVVVTIEDRKGRRHRLCGADLRLGGLRAASELLRACGGLHE